MPCGGDPTTGPFWSGPKMSRTFGQCRAARASLRISMRTCCHCSHWYRKGLHTTARQRLVDSNSHICLSDWKHIN